MNRNATGVVGAAVLVSVLASPAPPPAVPGNVSTAGSTAVATTHAGAGPESSHKSKAKGGNEDRKGGAEGQKDSGARARLDYSEALAGLFLDVCREDREIVEADEKPPAPRNAAAKRPPAPSKGKGGGQLPSQAVDWWTREVFPGDKKAAARLGEMHGRISSRCDLKRDQFILALVPDPVHTRLALSFDRALEVIQEAAADEEYDFVRALMPWDSKAHPESDDPEARRADQAYVTGREEFPGLLAFRKRQAVAGKPGGTAGGLGPTRQEHLFVWVVGESPTRGVVKKQFLNALEWIEATTRVPSPELRIFGPTFSGSLSSLAQLLRCPAEPESVQTGKQRHPVPAASGSACHGQVRIFSGTVTDRGSVLRFLAQERRLGAAFASFQEADDVMIDRFLKYTGYDAKRIAILSEDETEYGVGDGDQPEVCAGCLRLLFPREISRLRAAYQSSDIRIPGRDAASAPRDLLPLNLEISGADDDTVAAFSKQTPLSQEGVLLSIVSDLRKSAVQVIILRATDPLDLLFLSRYLATAYPKARIVTLGADMLFRREAGDSALHGILALSTYSLATFADREFLHRLEHPERNFPSSMEAGDYNALRALLEPSPGDGLPGPNCRYVLGNPSLHLYQYGWYECFRQESRDGDLATCDAPPVHLLALGSDEYWPIAHLGPSPQGDAAPPSRQVTLLPQVSVGQFAGAKTDRRAYHAPTSWLAAELAAVVLALGFAYALWFSSVLTPSQLSAQLAPAGFDARQSLILAAAVLVSSILLTLLFPFVAGSDLWVIEDGRGLHAVLWAALGVVLAASLVDLLNRGCLARATAGGAASHLAATGARKPAPWGLHWTGVIVLAGAAYVLIRWMASIQQPSTGALRHAMLRSIHLTSGLSPILPMLLLLAAGLWWAVQVSAGMVLLDDRHPRLPLGVRERRAAFIAEAVDRAKASELGTFTYTVQELMCAVKPTPSSAVPYLLTYLAGAAAPFILPVALKTLESEWYAWILWYLFLMPVLTLLVGTTLRLWNIWLKARRLLVMLDALPLRSGFQELKGFSWKPVWRLGPSLPEFQRTMSHVTEACNRAKNMAPEVFYGVPDPQLEELVYALKALTRLKHRFTSDWLKRRRQELAVITMYSTIQENIGQAAGRALDELTRQWPQEQESPRRRLRREAPDELRSRALERFICLVYVSYLLVVLIRIRSLIMAVSGVYILVLLSVTSYPFHPRATIQALAGLLLLFVITVVTMVFAQMHKNNTLSHITNTTPGELGTDFWIRTTSFVALPLFSFFASQFPQVNRFLYSWLEPALKALNK